jgi:hypothetical protein
VDCWDQWGDGALGNDTFSETADELSHIALGPSDGIKRVSMIAGNGAQANPPGAKFPGWSSFDLV